MTIKTSAGKTYDVEWVDASLFGDKDLVLQMTDPRRLPAIAAEFDGLQKIERFDENQGDKTFEGYTELKSIMRPSPEAVIISLGKPKEA